MDRRLEIERIAREHGLLAVYLFGSRADDGLRFLVEGEVEKKESDLDVGVVSRSGDVDLDRLFSVEAELETVFAGFRLDVVRLQRLDPLFQFEAIRGRRVAAPDPEVADSWELDVMRSAAELLPIQRANEVAMFGWSTT